MKLNISSEEIYYSMHETLKQNYKRFSKTMIIKELFYDALGKDKKNKDSNSFSLVMPDQNGKIFINSYKNNNQLKVIINNFLSNFLIK